MTIVWNIEVAILYLENEDVLDFLARVKCCITLIEQDSISSISYEMPDSIWLELLFLDGLSETEKQGAIKDNNVNSIEELIEVLFEVFPNNKIY